MELVLPYNGQSYYELNISGFKRKLPLVKVSNTTWIAYFDSLGDTDFISHCANELTPRLRGCDILMTSESKGIALVHEISKRLGHESFIVCRKERKPFMHEPITVPFKPITSAKELELCIDGRYREKLRNRKVGIVDDIVSTRQTIDAMETIVKNAGGIPQLKAAILVEGHSYEDIVSLGVLPIFKK